MLYAQIKLFRVPETGGNWPSLKKSGHYSVITCWCWSNLNILKFEDDHQATQYIHSKEEIHLANVLFQLQGENYLVIALKQVSEHTNLRSTHSAAKEIERRG